MLMHNDFKFTKNGQPVFLPDGVKTRWRCAYTKNGQYSCTAKANTFKRVNGTESVEYNGTHDHATQLWISFKINSQSIQMRIKSKAKSNQVNYMTTLSKRTISNVLSFFAVKTFLHHVFISCSAPILNFTFFITMWRHQKMQIICPYCLKTTII